MIESLEGRRLLATHAVTSLADVGPGSLRAAFASAANYDTIDASGLTGTITLMSMITLGIGRTGIRLVGPGQNALTIDASSAATAFTVAEAGLEVRDVTVQGAARPVGVGGAFQVSGSGSEHEDHYLTLTRVSVINSHAALFGGAIYTDDANLTISQSTFTNNQVHNVSVGGSDYGSAYGGAIAALRADVTVSDSTFHDNVAAAVRGETNETQEAYGGAIYATAGTLTANRSTFTANMTSSTDPGGTNPHLLLSAGGAIFVQGIGTLTDLTVTRNTAQTLEAYNDTPPPAGMAGGVVLLGLEGELASIDNSIIAANAGDPVSPDLYATGGQFILRSSLIGVIDSTTEGNESSSSGGNDTGMAEQPLEVLLGPLANNGGPTQTIAPLPGSLAIRTGEVEFGRTDQRGYTALDVADYGAFEVGGYDPFAGPDVPSFTVRPKAFIDGGATSGYLRGLAEVLSGDVTYQWTRLSKPANASDPVLATPDARITNAQFFKAGEYAYRLTANSDGGESISKKLIFTIDAIAVHVHVVRHGETIRTTSPIRFKANVYDQFGGRMSPAPTTKWSLLEGEGRLTSTGLYTPAQGTASTRIRLRARGDGIDGSAVNYIRSN